MMTNEYMPVQWHLAYTFDLCEDNIGEISFRFVYIGKYEFKL
jgi:hypothetical protein